MPLSLLSHTPIVPFLVEVPFRIVADLYRLPPRKHPAEPHLYDVDRDYAVYVRAKLEQLRTHPELSRVYLTDDLPALQKALWHVLTCFAKDCPTWLALDPQTQAVTHRGVGLTLSHTLKVTSQQTAPVSQLVQQEILSHLHSVTGIERLMDFLALSVMEDLVLVRNTQNTPLGDEAECLLVCLPSNWNPAEKLGLNFSEIHKPVGDNARLLKAHPNLLKTMINKGPFVRYGWSLPPSGALSQNPVCMTHPAPPRAAPPHELAGYYHFRVERQTILALPELSRSLFTIRIYSQPLPRVVNTPERRAQFAASLKSMPAESLAYKGITHYYEQLIVWAQTDPP